MLSRPIKVDDQTLRFHMIRCYSEFRHIPDYYERFEYLSLRGMVGEKTFGSERWLNQDFYRSREWKITRRNVIARDMGCDLGVPGFEIFSNIHVHHMNPIAVEDIVDFNDDILNPEYLITVTQNTHNAIHYGDASLLPRPIVERRPGDTTLWKM